ncbi:MAG TPA: DCC1-like thiol-disulfide oxidoreductase family protein [Bdellovibrionales bacterium]|nr:DCC1-like thiol-disulfide oxidoreductase family protein [Bdellovibrionales bacterium]
MAKETIVFFDGYCGLCSGLVDFLMKRDRHGRLRFAPLQGSTAAKLLTESERSDLDSIVIVMNGTKLKHSTAVLNTLIQVGGIWRLLGHAGLCFPNSFRNFVYRIVATNRYRWFGKLETCRIPTPEERSRFLD